MDEKEEEQLINERISQDSSRFWRSLSDKECGFSE